MPFDIRVIHFVGSGSFVNYKNKTIWLNVCEFCTDEKVVSEQTLETADILFEETALFHSYGK